MRVNSKQKLVDAINMKTVKICTATVLRTSVGLSLIFDVKALINFWDLVNRQDT